MKAGEITKFDGAGLAVDACKVAFRLWPVVYDVWRHHVMNIVSGNDSVEKVQGDTLRLAIDWRSRLENDTTQAPRM